MLLIVILLKVSIIPINNITIRPRAKALKEREALLLYVLYYIIGNPNWDGLIMILCHIIETGAKAPVSPCAPSFYRLVLIGIILPTCYLFAWYYYSINGMFPITYLFLA